ncbi:GNAT family N-acetyltransferase [Amycolatopsis minnesotensis]
MVHLRRLAEADWRTLREVRLATLADAPSAFGSTYADEAAFGEADWRGRLTQRTYFLATDGPGGEPLGVAAGKRGDGEWTLHSMWVAPAARGRGVAAKLIKAVTEEAVAHGAPKLVLQVAEANMGARRVYERHGFVATGEWETIPGMRRERMVLSLPARG